MGAIQVPGPWQGDFWVDTVSGTAWRRGSAGGVHGNKPLSEYGPDFQAAAREQIDLYNRATAPPEDPFGEIDWGALFAPSEQEQMLMNLQIQQIQSFVDQQNKLMAREEARRAAYNRYMTGGAFTAKNIEEQQGLLAARAAEISGIEQTRLKDALDGKLPVSPSTERAIEEGAAQLAERNLRELGPGGETSTPGIERRQRFDESAEILKDVDRKGYIERGIRPSIDAATFSAQQIGEYVPGEIPGASTALSGLRANRQLAASTLASLAGAGGGGDRGASYGLGAAGAYGDEYRKLQAASSGGGGIGGMLGGGLGSIAGGILGAIAGGAWNFGIGAPAGAAIGAGIGGSIGGIGGSLAGNYATGGGLGIGSLYGAGGGFNPSVYSSLAQPSYSRMAYGGPARTTFPYP